MPEAIAIAIPAGRKPRSLTRESYLRIVFRRIPPFSRQNVVAFGRNRDESSVRRGMLLADL